MQLELYSAEAEQVILGTCILNNSYLASVADILETKHFYFAEHQAIWDQFVAVASNGLADQVTLGSFFASNEALQKVGGKEYLATLCGYASTIVPIRQYALTVIELWQRRALAELLEQGRKLLGSEKFSSICAKLEDGIIGLKIHDPQKKTQHISEIMDDIELEEKNNVSAKFVPTGFKRLDELLHGGMYAQQLVVVGARPSIGKTGLAQNIILNCSNSKINKKCMFFSLEVDKKNLYFKFLSNLSSVPAWRIKLKMTRQSEEAALIKAKKDLRAMEIYVNDSCSITIPQITALLKIQIQKQPVDLIIVDYVQIVKYSDSGNKNEAALIKAVTTSLRDLGRQYNISVLALAQVGRRAVEGPKQEPTVNDFKGSGGIEEDADVAIILHRDRTNGQEDSYFSKAAKAIVVKNRNGPTGEVALDFDGEFCRFSELPTI